MAHDKIFFKLLKGILECTRLRSSKAKVQGGVAAMVSAHILSVKFSRYLVTTTGLSLITQKIF